LQSQAKGPKMIAFEVYVNGQKVCTAAHPDQGTLHAQVTRYELTAKRSPDTDAADQVLTEGMSVHVGGIRHGPSSKEHTNWFHRPVAVGDEVTIRVVETDSVDDPEPVDPELMKQVKGYLETQRNL